MVHFNKFFTSVFLAIAYASVSSAAPSSSTAKHSTHRARAVGRDLRLETFHPETTYQTFGAGLEQPNTRSRGGLKEDAIYFVGTQSDTEVEYKSGFTDGADKFAYLKQSHDGIPFANAVANVAWKNDKVVSFGSSFVKSKKHAPSTPTVSVESIIAKTEEALDGKYNGWKPALEYLARPDGDAALVHVVQIQNEEAGTWYEAFVDAHSGELLTVTDFVSHATYTVLPIKKSILTDGVEVLADPQDTSASPMGWHSTDGITTTTTTAGNNVIAYKSSQSSVTTQTSAGLNFNYKYDVSQAPAAATNLDAARTNAFYVMNALHDLTYKYGFTESSYNFQQNNFGKGGAGNDRVLMSVQDASGTNNAFFATPADGQSGTCRMYIWTHTNPNRDGSLENDIIVHEFTHGVTNRLTGGGTGRCLQTTEAGGMGEGWSDALADWTQHKSATVKDFVMGSYVTNNPAGIRTKPYSTSATTNPQKYSTLKSLDTVHRIGEVWANMLHNVYADLVGKYGFSTTAFTDPSGAQGNVVYLHLLIDALKLQPCNPTFVSARDAWIQADINRYGGANKCLLWKAFASRGLGVNAANYNDDSTVPAGC